MITIKLNTGETTILNTKYLLFKLWLEYSLEFKQTLLSKHSIIHYALLYSKNLLISVRNVFYLRKKKKVTKCV
jgi:hypothetical protein